MPGAYHDAAADSIERGNALGERSSVRQSRYFRQYESGNNVKALLGTGHLQWDTEKKEGVFAGDAVYDGRRQQYDYDAVVQHQPPPPPPQPQQPFQPAPHKFVAPPPQSQYEAPVRARGRGGTLDHKADGLWNAVGSRDYEEVARLLKQGGDPNMVCPDGWVRDECRPKDGGVGRSLLHHAAWAGELRIFKLLVDAGADVDRKRNTA